MDKQHFDQLVKAGRTRPSGPARVLLKIVASDPKSAIEALNA